MTDIYVSIDAVPVKDRQRLGHALEAALDHQVVQTGGGTGFDVSDLDLATDVADTAELAAMVDRIRTFLTDQGAVVRSVVVGSED